MKKIFVLVISLFMVITLCSFSYRSHDEINFDINNFYDYTKEFDTEMLSVCATGSSKTYMDYRATTMRSSPQYIYLNEKCKVDQLTGFLYDEEGFVAVALGSYYGTIGDRFYFTLDSGVVLPLVKAEGKADIHTDATNCYQYMDKSVIEFVVDTDIASNYFSKGGGLVLNGNYNNYPLFKGNIVKVEKVLDNKINENSISYDNTNEIFVAEDIFVYANGY